MEKQQRKNVIQEKSFAFAVKIVKFSRFLQMEQKESSLSKQLLRSGTSIGTNVEEAIGAHRKKEFIAKMSISAKEATETMYWLRILHGSMMIDSASLNGLVNECQEILTILNSIILTARSRLKSGSLSSPDIHHSACIIQNSELHRAKRGASWLP
ncbi:four helix bundle protein [Nitrospira sp. Nam80]